MSGDKVMKKCANAVVLLSLCCLLFDFLFTTPGCRRDDTSKEELQQEEVFVEEQPEEAAPKPAPPRMSDDVYVEISARSALIFEKYKEDMEQAQKEVEAVYEKFGVTLKEFRDFQARLTPEKSSELQKRVQDFIQKIAGEYR